MNLFGDLGCCGIHEVTGLGSTSPKSYERDLLSYLEEEYGDPNCAYFIFSQAGAGRYGETFKAWILEERLGRVQNAPSRVNPNSGNTLKVFIWTINQRNLRAWYRRKGGVTEEEDQDGRY